MISVELRGANELDKSMRDYHRRIIRYLQVAGMLTASLLKLELKRVAPKKMGRGARSIRFKPAGGERLRDGWVWTFFSYFYMLFTVPPGTRPHLIRAKRAKALRFYWEKGPRGPGIYFFRQVMHPGYKPPFDWRLVAIERTRHHLPGLLANINVEKV